ncbi:MAG TPA: hypothetical protein VHL09_01375 [Dehalococcoidia bacterium]|nr:hypothetical protein [Dehalococcoidia bacterium]
MPAKPVSVPAPIVPLVEFVEDTDPEDILPAALAKLEEGVSTHDLLAAAAIAVSRSTELPPGHHGGPVHPLSGIHAVRCLSERLSGQVRFVPVLQNVALANKHVHYPGMGPYILPEQEPLDASRIPGSPIFAGIPRRPEGDISEEAMIEATKEAYLKARGFMGVAEGHFLWLLPRVSRGELLDLLMTLAIQKNQIDDHNFLFPLFTWRAVEWLGWEYAPIVLRPPVRYTSRPPAPPDVSELKEVIAEYKLLDRPLRETSGPEETPVIGALGRAIGEVAEFKTIPSLIGRALADGLSLEGAGEALSIGAATLFLRSLGGNPMDVHLHTGVNQRRYLLRPESGLSLENKLLALLNWHTGPEVRNTQTRMAETPEPDPARVAALPRRDQAALLDAIEDSIVNQPAIDWSGVANIGQLRVVPEVQETVALTRQYADLNYDPRALIVRLGEVCCRDNFTEMHAYKHHQACVEEFENSRPEWRWLHLVSAARAAAISHGKKQDVFEEVRELLPA